MSREMAVHILSMFIRILGNGYHPDSFLSDYVDRDDKPSFTDEEIDYLEPLHDRVKDVLGDEIYDELKKIPVT